MKVKCIKLLDALGNPEERSTWLTLGKIYHVLEVVQNTRRNWLLRVLTDSDNRVALFPLEQFEIVSTKMPGAWIVDWNSKGILTLTTEAWNKPGFWEAYYEWDTSARSIFEEERKKIIDGDP